MDIYIALVHHPVLNRAGEIVTTAVTNLDIHDLARASRTYGVSGTILVTPVLEQRSLVNRIVGHWQAGGGAAYNPIRAEAFAAVHVAADVDEAASLVLAETGSRPLLVATGAKLDRGTTPYATMRRRFEEEGGSALLLFGTGWGLTDEVISRADAMLPAITAVPGRAGYNHLSVRSAVSIILDRLLGAR